MSTVAEVNPIYTPPGVSWTAPPKSRPWQNPPKYVKVEEVAAYYIMMLSNENIIDSALESIETGFPLVNIAEPLMLSSVANGTHSLDVGIIVMPVIMEMLATIAEMEGIQYDMFPEDAEARENKPTARQVKLAIKKAMEQGASGEADQQEVEEVKRGLMTKPTNEV